MAYTPIANRTATAPTTPSAPASPAPTAPATSGGYIPVADRSTTTSPATTQTVQQAVANTPAPSDNLEAKLFPSSNELASDIKIDPLDLQANPKNALSDFWDGIKGSVMGAADDIYSAFTGRQSTSQANSQSQSFQDQSTQLMNTIDEKKSAGQDYSKEEAQLNSLTKNAPNVLAPATPLQRIVGGLKGATVGELGTAFSPISSFFSAANDVPILGTVSKLASLGFSMVGEGATDFVGGIINTLPFSQKTKDTLTDGLGAVASLAAQIIAGGAVDEAAGGIIRGTSAEERVANSFRSDLITDNPDMKNEVGKINTQVIVDNVKKFGAQDAKTIFQKALDTARTDQNTTVETTPQPTQEDLEKTANEVKAQSQATKTPAVPEEKIPVTAEAAKASETSVEPEPSKEEEIKPITVGSKVESPSTSEETSVEKITTVDGTDYAKLTGEDNLVPVEKLKPTGNTISKKASDINKMLVAKGFDNIPEEEQGKFSSSEGQRKTQIESVAKLMDADIQKAAQIVLGKEPLPDGIQPQILLNAMVEKANADGNYALLRDLAGSPYAVDLSEQASALESSKYGKSKTETAGQKTVKAIREVEVEKAKIAEETAKKEGTTVKKKETAIEKKGAKLVEDKVTAKKSMPKLEAFLKSITC